MEKSTQAESQNPSLSLASISPATHVQINSACHLRKNIEIINLSQILFMSTVCCQFNCKIFQDRHRFKIPLSVFQMSSLQLYQNFTNASTPLWLLIYAESWWYVMRIYIMDLHTLVDAAGKEITWYQLFLDFSTHWNDGTLYNTSEM